MKKSILSLAIGVFCFSTSAQTVVEMSSSTFVDGVHPTFAVLFENTDAKVVEAFWKKQLKEMSDDLSTKKQLTAIGSRIPSIHLDTMAVFGKFEQRKKSPNTTMHLAFRVDNRFLGTDESEESLKKIEAAKEFIYAKSVQLKKDIVQAELDDANKALERLEKAYEGLVKEKERAEKNREKALDKDKDARKDKAKAEAELDGLKSTIATKQEEVGSDPSEENTEALNEMLKDRDKATSERDKADKTMISMDKKVKDLDHTIKKNIEDQSNTQAEIEKQKEVVKTLTEKLANVH